MTGPKGRIRAGSALANWRWVALVLVAAGIVGLAISYPVIRQIDLEDIEALIATAGAWAVVASIALMVLHSFVPFPAEFLAIANGMMFGPLMGIVVTWIGAMLGASLAFALTRWLGRPFVQKIANRGKLAKADLWLEKSGWQVMLLARLLPLIAFNLINYAAGLSRISWWTFLWTTSVGILPLTILMVVAGDNVDIIIEYWRILAFGALILCLVFALHWLRRRAR